MWKGKDNKTMKTLILLMLIAPPTITEYKYYTIGTSDLGSLFDSYFGAFETSVQDLEYQDALDILSDIDAMIDDYDKNSFVLLKAEIQHIITGSKNKELQSLMVGCLECSYQTLRSRIRQARKILIMKDRNIRTQITHWRSL